MMAVMPRVAAVAGCLIVLGVSGAGASGALSAGAPGLPFSTASSTIVQPQPPAGSCHATGSDAFSGPDLRCTPGARNPSVKQSTIDMTICVKGYSATVRPPSSITHIEKIASMGCLWRQRCVLALRVRPSRQPRAGRSVQRPAQPVARAGQDPQPQRPRREPPAPRRLQPPDHADRRPARDRQALGHDLPPTLRLTLTRPLCRQPGLELPPGRAHIASAGVERSIWAVGPPHCLDEPRGRVVPAAAESAGRGEAGATRRLRRPRGRLGSG
jgi:hypothetical protein